MLTSNESLNAPSGAGCFLPERKELLMRLVQSS